MSQKLERYRIGDLPTVEPAVFNENFVGMHARYDYTCKKNALSVALKSIRIRARLLSIRFQNNPARIKKR
jgi:hypothetical protein